MEDSIHHRQLRAQLVKELLKKGIHDQAVLQAIASVPRHLFIDDPHQAAKAYEDVALGIAEGQSISQPYTVAYQTELLAIKPGEKILEIGTGSGYQAAVLFELGAKVYSLERQETLFASTRSRLSELGYANIKLFLKDGYEGLSEKAPFDKILVTAAAEEVPAILVGQLKINGVMVIPVGKEVQKMLRITKLSDTEIRTEVLDNFRFVPMLAGIVSK